MQTSPSIADYHLAVTSSVNDSRLISATWSANQALQLQVNLSQQISHCRLGAPSSSSARALDRPTASG